MIGSGKDFLQKTPRSYYIQNYKHSSLRCSVGQTIGGKADPGLPSKNRQEYFISCLHQKRENDPLHIYYSLTQFKFCCSDRLRIWAREEGSHVWLWVIGVLGSSPPPSSHHLVVPVCESMLLGSLIRFRYAVRGIFWSLQHNM